MKGSPHTHIKRGGFIAVLGGGLGLALTPLLIASWYKSELEPWLEANPSGVSSLFSDGPAYTTYGRIYCLIFPAFLVGLLALHARSHEAQGRLGRVGFGVMGLGLVASVLGCIADYWLKWTFTFRDSLPTVHIAIGVGYTLALLGVLVGSLLYGIGMTRRPGCSRWGRILLIASGPAGVLLSFIHIPSGTMLVASVAWVLLGWSLWRGRSCPESAP